MADPNKSQEFLGGGPKFNTVGRDNRSVAGQDEPVIPINRTGYSLRVAGIVAILILLAGTLFYLNERSLGKVIETPRTQIHAVSPDSQTAPTADPNFK